MTAPQFISTDVTTIVNEMIASYELRTGRVIQPAHVERLIINEMAYREGLVRAAIQDVATQNLVDFARAPFLDYLGALVGVIRLASTYATVLLEFELVAGHGGVTIPVGTRVTSIDGQALFATIEAVSAASGTNTVTVEASCNTLGTAGNNYAIGSIGTLIDVQPFITAVTNTDASAGGADTETDDELRERIKLAPAGYSNAGSSGAYQFHAKGASPAIIDVAVVSPPGTGEVYVYPLMSDGSITPTQVLDDVELALNDERIRPLTDLVIVEAPTKVDYDLDVELILYNSADTPTTVAAVEASLLALTTAKRQALGQDVPFSQVIAAAQLDGVYDVTLPTFTGLVIDATEYPFCTAINVVVTSYTNG